MIDISVVIPTYNNKSMLKELVSSLHNQNFRGRYEIIIVDDGSTDGTEKVVRELDVIYIKQKNSGPAKARNAGIKKASGRIIAMIDDDCMPDKNWLSAFKEAFDKNKDAVAVEGRTVTEKSRITADSHFIRNEKGGMYVTCNMAFLSQVVKKLKFDETYKFPNREDSDLAFRIISGGGKIFFAKNAVVVHRLMKFSLKKMLRRKLYFESDVLLFKRQKRLYKERIGFPFEKFTPFYIFFVLLSIVNPLFLVAVVATAVVEMVYRRYSFSVAGFLKFLVAQSVGSFLVLFGVLRACARYRVNPFSFL